MDYLLPSSIYLTEEVHLHTPPPVLAFIQEAVEEMLRLKKQVEEHKTRLGMNSSNSSTYSSILYSLYIVSNLTTPFQELL